MSKRIVILSLSFLLLGNVFAQEKLNFVEVDKASYDLFQQQKWQELIDYSAEARDQRIDFFYLQARTGIAYYNLKKFRTSSQWFLKAWENDQSFEWLQEYLYYSLVYGGRASEAIKVAVNFTPQMQKSIGFTERKLTRLALEAGVCVNPEFDELKALNLDEQAGLGDNYGEAYFLEDYHFEALDLSHQVSPGFFINHNLTYIGVSREEQVDWGARNSFPVKTKQLQYFLNPYFVLGKKLYISPSVSIVWGKSSYFAGTLNSNLSRNFTEVDYNYSDIIFSTSMWSHFGNISPGVEVNLANITDSKLTQLSGWISYYPFSNTNFYLTPRVYFKAEEGKSLAFNTLGISGGLQLGKIHLYGQYLNGDMKNFVESAGYVIANFPGKSDQKISGSIFVPVGKTKQIVFRYINQNIKEKYQVYTAGVKSTLAEYKYLKHTLTVGLSWNF